MKHDSVVVLVLRKASSMLGFTWLRKTYQFFLPHKNVVQTLIVNIYIVFTEKLMLLIFCENEEF